MPTPWSASDRESSHPSYSNLLDCSDEQIMHEMQSGNNDAFAVVFRRYHRLVHSTALRILRDAGEAEDLTQSVFLEIYRKVGQFDPSRGTLKVWLLQFAYSRSISRRNYLLAREVYSDLSAEEEAQGAMFFYPRRAPAQETSLLTEQILGALPDPQRETLRMFFFQGLTLKEIAMQRKETFSNVRHHYYRGLQRLRSLLEREVQEKNSQQRVSIHEVQRAEA
jgi:RNA polymerase sigma-70 factor, ECF subfamily